MERDKELNSLRKKIRDYEQVSVCVCVCVSVRVSNKLQCSCDLPSLLSQGVTGLSEAVEAIKKKKEELTLRDKYVTLLPSTLSQACRAHCIISQ